MREGCPTRERKRRERGREVNERRQDRGREKAGSSETDRKQRDELLGKPRASSTREGDDGGREKADTQFNRSNNQTMAETEE